MFLSAAMVVRGRIWRRFACLASCSESMYNHTSYSTLFLAFPDGSTTWILNLQYSRYFNIKVSLLQCNNFSTYSKISSTHSEFQPKRIWGLTVIVSQIKYLSSEVKLSIVRTSYFAFLQIYFLVKQWWRDFFVVCRLVAWIQHGPTKNPLHLANSDEASF